MATFDKKLIPHAAEATHLILESVIPGRIDPTSRDFTSVFLPDVQLTAEAIEAWCASSKGNTPASNYSNSDASALQSLGLVRQKNLQSRPWVAKEFVAIEEEVLDKEGNPGVTVEVLHVRGIIWPKRTDFSHPVSGEAHTHEKSYRVDRAMVANLPAAYSRFGLFVPALLHRLELYLHAQELRDTILKPLGIEDLDLVVTAISSPVAQEQTNYQRLEFLGDAALKLYTSMQLAAAKPQWHEGLLTAFKEKIVSNHRLSAAAIEKGIDRYILVDVFTGLKWRPNYNKNLAEPEELPTRELSTKVLADVVEALIGATLLDGDLDKIKTSLDFFLPEVSWLSVDEQNRLLFDEVPQELDDVSFANVEKIEKMIGYQFEKKTLLIEALTHPSTLCATMPYQRLEFVGDALLDFFVTRPIFDSPLELSAPEMHLMRSVLVNGDFLAFLCMNISCDEERHEVVPGKRAETVTTKKINQRLNLVQTMRHGNPDLVDPQNKTLERFEHLKGELDVALKTSERYPWVSLCKIQAPKYMSDLVESLLGAIFVDSHGSTDECLKFLSRIGLLQYLERVITGKIRLKHPKQELGELVGIRK
ncbi:Dicer-like protein 2, partial [Ascosphaera atra]